MQPMDCTTSGYTLCVHLCMCVNMCGSHSYLWGANAYELQVPLIDAQQQIYELWLKPACQSQRFVFNIISTAADLRALIATCVPGSAFCVQRNVEYCFIDAHTGASPTVHATWVCVCACVCVCVCVCLCVCVCMCVWAGLAIPVYMSTVYDCVFGWFTCQKYRAYTVYIYTVWPTKKLKTSC